MGLVMFEVILKRLQFIFVTQIIYIFVESIYLLNLVLQTFQSFFYMKSIILLNEYNTRIR